MRAVIPQEVAKKLKLRLSDTLEWSENRSGDIVVKNIGTPVFMAHKK